MSMVVVVVAFSPTCIGDTATRLKKYGSVIFLKGYTSLLVSPQQMGERLYTNGEGNKSNTRKGVGVEGVLTVDDRQQLHSDVLPSALDGHGSFGCEYGKPVCLRKGKLFGTFSSKFARVFGATITPHQDVPVAQNCPELLVDIYHLDDFMPQDIWGNGFFAVGKIGQAYYVPLFCNLLDIASGANKFLVTKVIQKFSVLLTCQSFSQLCGDGGKLLVEVIAKVRFVGHDFSLSWSNSIMKLILYYNKTVLLSRAFYVR